MKISIIFSQKSSHEELLNKFKYRTLKVAIQTQLVEFDGDEIIVPFLPSWFWNRLRDEHMENRGEDIINIKKVNVDSMCMDF